MALTRDICSQPDVWYLDRGWKVDVTAPVSASVICVELSVWGCLGFVLKCVVAFQRLESSLGDYVEMIFFLHHDLLGVAAEKKKNKYKGRKERGKGAMKKKR